MQEVNLNQGAITKALDQLSAECRVSKAARRVQLVTDTRILRDSLRELESTPEVKAFCKLLGEEGSAHYFSRLGGVRTWREPDREGEYERFGKKHYTLCLTGDGFRMSCESYYGFKNQGYLALQSKAISQPETIYPPGVFKSLLTAVGLLSYGKAIKTWQLQTLVEAGVKFEDVKEQVFAAIQSRLESKKS